MIDYNLQEKWRNKSSGAGKNEDKLSEKCKTPKSYEKLRNNKMTLANYLKINKWKQMKVTIFLYYGNCLTLILLLKLKYNF